MLVSVSALILTTFCRSEDYFKAVVPRVLPESLRMFNSEVSGLAVSSFGKTRFFELQASTELSLLEACCCLMLKSFR